MVGGSSTSNNKSNIKGIVINPEARGAPHDKFKRRFLSALGAYWFVSSIARKEFKGAWCVQARLVSLGRSAVAAAELREESVDVRRKEGGVNGLLRLLRC